MIERQTVLVDNGHGWRLALHRWADPAALDRSRPPVVLVPGYAMNSFILGYHPRARGIAPYLAARGFEVWAADLRGQGGSQRQGGARRYRLEDVGLVDLSVAINQILGRTETDADAVDLIGCSLGATYMFMHAAWWPEPHARRLVNLGGPLRWTAAHPLLKLLSVAPPLWGALPVRNLRPLARAGLPLAAKIPGLLHMYLHPAICDLSEPGELCRTVDDPSPTVNRQLARWMADGDLRLGTRNLTAAVSALTHPLLTVVANADGVVPEDTVCSAHNVMTGSTNRRIVYAGTASTPMAHADLFISDPAPAAVFAPIAEWLAAPA